MGRDNNPKKCIMYRLYLMQIDGFYLEVEISGTDIKTVQIKLELSAQLRGIENK